MKPVYSDKFLQEHTELREIELAPISTVGGAEFYHHLKQLLPSQNSDVKYILVASFQLSKAHAIVLRNSDVLRESQILRVSCQLIDKKSGNVIHQFSFIKQGAYNSAANPYSNEVERVGATNDLYMAAALMVRNYLLLFFSSKKQDFSG